jgi:hypothetical protein
MREYKSPPDPGDGLMLRLHRALIDPYQRRNKTSRDYPRKKHESATGRPIILVANRTQIQQAKQVTNLAYEKRLTA